MRSVCQVGRATLPNGGEKFQCSASDFVQTCPTSNDNPYPVCLFDAMDWIYEMINIKPVWASGISKLLLQMSTWKIEVLGTYT